MRLSRIHLFLILAAFMALAHGGHSEQGTASNGAGTSIGGPTGGTSDGVTDVKARKRVGDGVIDPFGA